MGGGGIVQPTYNFLSYFTLKIPKNAAHTVLCRSGRKKNIQRFILSADIFHITKKVVWSY